MIIMLAAVTPVTGICSDGKAEAIVTSSEGTILIKADSVENKTSGQVELCGKVEEKDVEYALSNQLDKQYAAIKFYFSGGTDMNKTSVEISKEAIKKIYTRTDVPLEVETYLGKVTMDTALLKWLEKDAAGDTVEIVIEKMKLSASRRSLFGENALARKVYFKSGGKKICKLGDSNAEVEFFLYGVEDKTDYESAGRLITSGKLLKTDHIINENPSGNLSCRITEDYLGTFIIGSASRIYEARLITGVMNTTVKLSVKDVASGYISLKWTKSKGFKVDGYQVYDANTKKGQYIKRYTTSKLSCYNEGIKSGTKKYYKVRGYRKIGNNIYYTKWSNIVSETAK